MRFDPLLAEQVHRSEMGEEEEVEADEAGVQGQVIVDDAPEESAELAADESPAGATDVAAIIPKSRAFWLVAGVALGIGAAVLGMKYLGGSGLAGDDDVDQVDDGDDDDEGESLFERLENTDGLLDAPAPRRRAPRAKKPPKAKKPRRRSKSGVGDAGDADDLGLAEGEEMEVGSELDEENPDADA